MKRFVSKERIYCFFNFANRTHTDNIKVKQIYICLLFLVNLILFMYKKCYTCTKKTFRGIFKEYNC